MLLKTFFWKMMLQAWMKLKNLSHILSLMIQRFQVMKTSTHLLSVQLLPMSLSIMVVLGNLISILKICLTLTKVLQKITRLLKKVAFWPREYKTSLTGFLAKMVLLTWTHTSTNKFKILFILYNQTLQNRTLCVCWFITLEILHNLFTLNHVMIKTIQLVIQVLMRSLFYPTILLLNCMLWLTQSLTKNTKIFLV